jgi:D-alanyl-D-alanine carboxypeptidase (penicillin-binding protein 5/6)
MASTTKIMTSIIAIENSDLNQKVEISAKAANTGGSRLGLKKGDTISMRDLLYGLMLRSGNDAAVAIAEAVGGDLENFAVMMNEKAEKLNLSDTHFVTPHGLDDPDHYTTAYELAKITDYALNNEIFKEIVGSKTYTITINGYPKTLNNTNELLGVVQGVYGVKTGFTGNAGRCLVTSVNRNGFEIITVVLQADTKKDRGKDSKKIIEYVYENYQQVNVKNIVEEKFEEWCNINKGRIEINKAVQTNFDIGYEDVENELLVVKKTQVDDIQVQIDSTFKLEAPIKKGCTIGNLKLIIDGELVDSMCIFIKNDVAKKNIYDYFMECVKAYKSLKFEN